MDKEQTQVLFSYLKKHGVDKEKLQLLLSTGATLTGATGLRRWVAERDIEYFCKAYFASEFTLAMPRVHRVMLKSLQDIADRAIQGKPGLKLAYAIPRGHSKTTLVARILPIHGLLFSWSPLTVLLGNNATAARRMLKNIRECLETNEALQEDFGVISGDVWRDERLEYDGNVIVCFGVGSGAIRGVSTPAQRPSLIIGDDLDDDGSVRSAVELEAQTEWLDKNVMALGDNVAFTTSYCFVGTILRRTSLIQHIIDSPDFTSTVEQGVKRFADNSDLWDQWRNNYIALAKAGKKPVDAESDEFYVANKDAMLQGTELLWPRKDGYWNLQVYRLSRGEAAFYSEIQNQPREAGGTLGKMPRIKTPPAEELSASWWRVAALDPTIRGGKTNDKSAWVEAYYNPTRKELIFSYCDAAQRPASKTVDVVMKRLRTPQRFSGLWVESNSAGTLIADSIQQQIDKESLNYSITQIHNSKPKDDRIGALSIYAARQQIFFSDDIDPELINEFEGYPGYRWDDALDACATIVQELAKQGFLDL